MKKLLLIILLFAGCKKDKEPIVIITVKDDITGLPVKDVGVSLIVPPLVGNGVIASAITNDEGTCHFLQRDYDRTHGIKTVKARYCENYRGKSLTILISPEGCMRLRVIRVTNYPAESNLQISTILSGLNFPTVGDSTILMKCPGARINQIDWSVLNTNTGTLLNSGTWQQQIPLWDTVSATLNY